MNFELKARLFLVEALALGVQMPGVPVLEIVAPASVWNIIPKIY